MTVLKHRGFQKYTFIDTIAAIFSKPMSFSYPLVQDTYSRL